MPSKPQVIALEEHYIDPEVKPHIGGRDRTGGPVAARLDDVGAGPHRRDGRGRHRHPGAVARRAVGAAARRGAGGPAGDAAPTTGWPRRCAPIPTASPASPCCRPPIPKAAADELERAVTRLGFKGAMVHGLTGEPVSRRQAVLADLRAGAGARRAALPAPGDPASGGDRRLLQGICRQVPEPAARRLGLYGRDRDPGHPDGLERRVRHLSAAEDHPGPSGRGAAVPAVAHQHGAGARRRRPDLVPRHLLRAFLDHDQRLLLRPGAAVLRPGDGRRPHPVLGRLPVRRERRPAPNGCTASRSAPRTRRRS